MIRLPAILLLLAACLGAADEFDATPLRWPAGELRLADAIALLQTDGNRVALAEAVDDRRSATLGAHDGTWWEGVAAICAAYGLRPDEGEPCDDQGNGNGSAVPVGHGTLVLSAGGDLPTTLAPQRGMLAILGTGGVEGGVRLWFRAEPRVPRQRLAWGRATDAALRSDGGEAMQLTSMQDGEDGVAATWRLNPPGRPRGHFTAQARLAALEAWRASAQLTAGQATVVAARGQELPAILVTDAAMTEWQGAPLPERRPLIAILGPSDMSQGLTVRVRSGESDLPTRGGTVRTMPEDRSLVIRYLRAAPEGPVELLLEGKAAISSRQLDLSIPLPTAGRGAAAERDLPSTLVWPAGRRPLSAWLAALSATGNPVLPEVGVDTTAETTVAAVRGGFWDGVVAISAATGLVPAPAREGGIGSGAVRLVARPLPGMTACGPILVSATAVERTSGDGDHWISVALALAAEPATDAERMGPPTLAWSSWATAEDGSLHPVQSSVTSWTADEDRTVRWLRTQRGGQGEPRLAVRLRTQHPGRLTCSGLLMIPRVTAWKGTCDVDARGPATELVFGPRAVTITPSQGGGFGNSNLGPGLLLRGLPSLANLHVSVTLADGQAIESGNEAQRLGGPRGWQWFWNGRLPADGKLTVELSGRAPEPPLALPVHLTIQVPAAP